MSVATSVSRQVRLPRGYQGHNHETLGSDILAVVESLTLPRLTLGDKLTKHLSQVDPDAWYPISLLLQAMESIERKVGLAALRRMGQVLFRITHEGRVAPPSARAVIYGIDDMYHHANRGENIGGWKVLQFEPGVAQLEKNTPHHCVMEEGILIGALKAAGVPALITQTQCFRKGADVCVYRVQSAITDERWSGEPRA